MNFPSRPECISNLRKNNILLALGYETRGEKQAEKGKGVKEFFNNGSAIEIFLSLFYFSSCSFHVAFTSVGKRL